MAKPNRKAAVAHTEAPAPTEVVTQPAVAAPEIAVPVAVVEAPKIAGTAAELIAKYGNKSNSIRALSALGHKTAQIATALGIRYQHARNVLNQPLKRVIKAEQEAGKVTQGEITRALDEEKAVIEPEVE